jgi:hypothetical protein
MLVRPATQADDDHIIDCLRKFAEEQPISKLKVEANQYNDHHVRKILDAIRQRGVILIAEIDSEITGLLMAVVNPDIWLPQIKTMNELVWWVHPEHRNSSAGLRLLKEYTKICEKKVKRKEIHTFTMTLLEDSPVSNIEKRGWAPIETNYVYGVK